MQIISIEEIHHITILQHSAIQGSATARSTTEDDIQTPGIVFILLLLRLYNSVCGFTQTPSSFYVSGKLVPHV